MVFGLVIGVGGIRSHKLRIVNNVAWPFFFKAGTRNPKHDLVVSQNQGTILGVPIIRTVVFGDLYWGPLIWGNYQSPRVLKYRSLAMVFKGLAFETNTCSSAALFW